MKKRIVSILLCVCLTVGLLSGCGTQVDATNDEVRTSESAETTAGNKNTAPDKSVESTQETTSTEVSETVSETEESENKYTVTSTDVAYGYGSAYCGLDDFFQLLLEDYCEWLLSDGKGDKDKKPVTVENMLTHGQSLWFGNGKALVYADPALIIAGNYNEDNFDYALSSTAKSFYANLFFVTTKMQQAYEKGSSVSYKYGCNVSVVKSNIGAFTYYAGTDAVIRLIVEAEYTLEYGDYSNTSEVTYAVEMMSETEEPLQWLITGLYIAEDNGDGTYSIRNDQMRYTQSGEFKSNKKIILDDFDLDTKLVPEDVAKKAENALVGVSDEELQEVLMAYSQVATGWYNILFDFNNSEIPYFSDGESIYHYENGEVVLVPATDRLYGGWFLYSKIDSPYVVSGEEATGGELGFVYELIDGKLTYIMDYSAGSSYYKFLKTENIETEYTRQNFSHSYDDAIEEYMSTK